MSAFYFHLGGIQLHAGGEQLLDREIVQVASDTISLVEQCGHVFSVLSGGELQCQGGLRCE